MVICLGASCGKSFHLPLTLFLFVMVFFLPSFEILPPLLLAGLRFLRRGACSRGRPLPISPPLLGMFISLFSPVSLCFPNFFSPPPPFPQLAPTPAHLPSIHPVLQERPVQKLKRRTFPGPCPPRTQIPFILFPPLSSPSSLLMERFR